MAWHAALLRPDRFRAVIGLSVPLRPRGAVRPTAAMPRTDEAIFYQLYFQTPGVAEAELERDVRATMRRLAYSGSGDAPGSDSVAMVRLGSGFLDQTTDPDRLPSSLTAADIDFYAGEFARTGFRGGLNWYHNIDRNWELLAPFAGTVITVPALYVAGDCDLVVRFPGMDQLISNLSTFVPPASANGHASRLRALDATGAVIRGERPHARIPEGRLRDFWRMYPRGHIDATTLRCVESGHGVATA